MSTSRKDGLMRTTYTPDTGTRHEVAGICILLQALGTTITYAICEREFSKTGTF